MRSAAVALLLVVFGSSAHGQARKLGYRRALAPDAYVRLWNMSGSIRTVGWDKDSIVLSGTSSNANDRFFSAGGYKSVKMGFDGDQSGTADITLYVPRTITLWIKTADATVDVSGFAGALDVYSVTGRITVDGTLRQLNAESMGGNIELAASAPSLRAKNGAGAITLRGGGDDISLSTVDGAIRASGTDFRRARFESVSGRVEFEGVLAAAGSATFQTHSGPVEIRLPANTPTDFEISTFEGHIRSDFPAPKPARAGFKGTELSFSNGGGGAQINIRTFSGDILLRKHQ